MRGRLRAWVNRLAAIALLIPVFGGAYLFVVAPLVEAYRSADEERESAEELLSHYEAIAATRKTYSAQLDELEARQTDTDVYLSGATGTLASAKLQERVRNIVSSSDGQLGSIQTLPSKADGEHLRVSVRLRFKANLGSLYRILYSIESLRPFAFVDNLDVRNRRSSRRKALEDLDPSLTVRIDISGFIRPDKTS